MCNIIMKNNGIDKSYPKYFLHLEKNNKFLLAAKKRPGNTTSNYIITMNSDNFEKESGESLGKLRANFMGTEFNIYDKGKNPSESKNYLEVRTQFGAILYVKLGKLFLGIGYFWKWRTSENQGLHT